MAAGEETDRSLAQAVASFCASLAEPGRVRRRPARSEGFERATWERMAGLGWCGALLPEHYGGTALAFAQMALIAREFGRALVPEPLVAAAALAAQAIVHGDNEALRARLLPALAGGSLIPSLAWQERDGGIGGECATTAVRAGEGFRLRGEKRFVYPAAGADGFVVSARAPAGVILCWVPRSAPGLDLALEERADGSHAGRLRLDQVSVPDADVVASASVGAQALERAVDEAIVLAGAELLGVMTRALELTLDYLRTRVQFGRPIGSFQALQHRAADLFVQQSLSEALVRWAAERLDDASCAAEARSVAASRIKARLAEAAVHTCAEAVQMHGAMGMAEECDIGLFLQRSLVLAAWLGNAQAHRRRHAARALAEPAEPARDAGGGGDWSVRADAIGVDPAPDWNALDDGDFRALMRAFFERHTPQHLRYLPRRARWHEFSGWYREQSRRGLIAPGWPREYGGMGLAPAKQRIFLEEQERYALVRGGLEIGITMVGPLLMRYGTPEQRTRYLPAILAGEHVWCQGYSEPNAGSDLANLTTSARIEGDVFVVNGRKIWTSMAQDASHAVLLVRTDPQAKKQAGISFLLLDLATPGVARRAFNTIAGEVEFCELLLDDVRVPASAIVGRINEGWTMAKNLLGFERVWIGSPKRCMSALERIDAIARDQGLYGDAAFVSRFVRLELDVADLGCLYEEYVTRIGRGEEIGPDVSVLKIWATETFQRLSELAIEMAGDCGALRRDFAFGGGRLDVLSPYYEGRGATIGGGSSEIQRNIIARQVLGLPG
ncbi:MAG: acyl-CoA dehydrogenase [Burkholderiales bacterium]|nr:acyl-CoA dehydrogenase [Burkholderiales bacterium]